MARLRRAFSTSSGTGRSAAIAEMAGQSVQPATQEQERTEQAAAVASSTRTPSARIAARVERAALQPQEQEEEGVSGEGVTPTSLLQGLREAEALLALGNRPFEDGGRDDQEIQSNASEALRAPHLVERDALLGAANLSLFEQTFDEAGFERLDQMLDFSADDLISELRDVHAGRGGTMRRVHEFAIRKLHARVVNELAPGPAEVEPARRATVEEAETVAAAPASAPAAAEQEPAPTTTPAKGAYAKKKAKVARKKEAEREQAEAAPAEARAPEVAASAKRGKAKTPVAMALRGVDELLGASSSRVDDALLGASSSRVDEDPYATDPYVGAQSTDDDSEVEETSAVRDASVLPLLTKTFDAAFKVSDGRSEEGFVDSFFELAAVAPPGGSLELKAEELELMLRECVDSGGMRFEAVKCARTMRMEFKRAFKAAKAKGAQPASGATHSVGGPPAEDAARAREQEARRMREQHERAMERQGTALVAALSAASAPAPSQGDQQHDEQDAPRERVANVAGDAEARELLNTLRVRGEEAITSQTAEQIEAFLKLQADAQVKSASLAQLLHTSNLPTPKGVYADPDVAQTLWTGAGSVDGAHLALRSSVARDGAKVQRYIISALAFKLEGHVAGGEPKRMAQALFYGSLVQVTSATGTFKMGEMAGERALGLFFPQKSAEEAKNLITALASPLTNVLRKAFPNDDSVEDVIAWAMRDAAGMCTTKAYHNEVFGEIFKYLAKMFAAWREGDMIKLPTLKSAYTKAMSNPRLTHVTSGTADRDKEATDAKARSIAATERAERAEAAAREAKANASKGPPRKSQPPEKPGTPDLSGTQRQLGAPGESVFKVSGKDRNAMRIEQKTLFASYKEADEAAKAAEAASASDASSKRSQANAVQAKIDANKAKLAERK